MANSFEHFEEPHAIDLEEVDQELAHANQKESESIPSFNYEDAMLAKASLEGQMLDLRGQIKKAETHEDDKEIARLENLLRVAERDLEEAKESIAIEENKMQEAARAKRDAVIRDKDQDEAIRINKNVDRMSDKKEAIHWDQTMDAIQKTTDQEEGIRVNENIDRMTAKNEALKMDAEFVRDEAEHMNEDMDAYADAKASAERSLAYYAQGTRKIERQKALVASLDNKPDPSKAIIADLRAQIKAEEKRDGKDVHENVNRLEALLHKTEQAPPQKVTETAILANMEKVFPAQEADAKKFVEQYLGKNAVEHQAAVELYSLEVKKADGIESLMHVIERWGGIPEGNKFVTNTKFRQDLEAILHITSEDEKIAELERVTKNDEVCEKLLELYRKDRDEALVEVEDSAPTGKKIVTLGMRQPNLPPERIAPVPTPELLALLKDEQRFRDLSEVVSSTRFKRFPAALYASKDGREALKLLNALHVPMGTRYERETSAPIAVALQLRAAIEARARMEEHLGIDMQDRVHTGNTLMKLPNGPVVMPSGSRNPSLPKDPRRSLWNRFIGRS